MRYLLLFTFIVFCSDLLQGQPLLVAGKPGQLSIRKAGNNSLRITLQPQGLADTFPFTPALADRRYPAPVIALTDISTPIARQIGTFKVTVSGSPLSITVSNAAGQLVQHFIFTDDGKLSFSLSGAPVLGMGEGGPKPAKTIDWRALPVQYDRSGAYDSMQPRWQGDAYGSRNPVPLLAGTDGWAIFVATPWVEVDLRQKTMGYFVPRIPDPKENVPQTVRNQGLNNGKGLPPVDRYIPGQYDFFVFDAHDPAKFIKDFSVITGPAALPPKWALGYMQSHRTLDDDTQMVGIIDSFRSKKIPLDAVIYLGTGFTPRGWNKNQPSFEFNPEVFKHEPKEVLTAMHNRHVKVVLHMVPWDRDKIPNLHGSIPALAGETKDGGHVENYWQEHMNLVKSGVDAFWPDEGDWFNLFERIKRHQLYYQGSLVAHPNLRPWSLQRNGFAGIAKWGGWVWSGDTQSSWKTLEAQIAVGINYSLSTAPFWGSDIGGFTPSAEKTAELYIRWFQFGSFCASFRSHGRTWKTSLPWGYGLTDMNPTELNNQNAGTTDSTDKRRILQSEMNNPNEEPITRKYDELHYQLMPYTYTVAWEARQTGMPMMRALWLHYPNDEQSRKTGDEYLWGRDMLIAPVYEKSAVTRTLYLPQDDWYDWWTGKKQTGGTLITRSVDLGTMPIYVRAGAIIPVDPVRQYTAEHVAGPTTLKVFTGADGLFTLYDDDGITQDYLKGISTRIKIAWNEKQKILSLSPDTPEDGASNQSSRSFTIQLLPGNETKTIDYTGKAIAVKW